MEICIIELPKFGKYKQNINNSLLNSWLKFIKNPEVISMNDDNKMVNKAREVLEEISSDEREQYLAELREKYIMDQKAIEDAGFDKGLKQGLEQGKKKSSIEIAKRMKKKGIDIDTISQITALTVDEVKNLN